MFVCPCACFRAWQSPGSCLAYPALSQLKSQISILPAKLAEQDCGKAMLSGSWRRSFGHQQPTAGSVVNSRGMTVCGVPSGTVVLEAQYDYSYRGADGRQVCIREGERFILLKKTNADWWQVRIFFFIFSVFCVSGLINVMKTKTCINRATYCRFLRRINSYFTRSLRRCCRAKKGCQHISDKDFLPLQPDTETDWVSHLYGPIEHICMRLFCYNSFFQTLVSLNIRVS